MAKKDRIETLCRVLGYPNVVAMQKSALYQHTTARQMLSGQRTKRSIFLLLGWAFGAAVCMFVWIKFGVPIILLPWSSYTTNDSIIPK